MTATRPKLATRNGNDPRHHQPHYFVVVDGEARCGACGQARGASIHIERTPVRTA